MDIVALIPARSGSKGVPDKNIAALGDRPVLAWTIAACQKADIFRRIIVSTDSVLYADLAVSLGAEAPFLRPSEISTDASTDYDFIAHALAWLEDHDQLPEFIAHMRPTTPLRDPQLIVDAVDAFVGNPNASALRSVHTMAESAYKTFEIYQEQFLKSVGTQSTALDAANAARQSFPTTYQANGYVDVLSVDYVRSNQQLHGDRVVPFITPVVTEIDSHEDFAHLVYDLECNPAVASCLFA